MKTVYMVEKLSIDKSQYESYYKDYSRAKSEKEQNEISFKVYRDYDYCADFHCEYFDSLDDAIDCAKEHAGSRIYSGYAMKYLEVNVGVVWKEIRDDDDELESTDVVQSYGEWNV